MTPAVDMNSAVDMRFFDVVIIGGGPIGLACGIAAKEAGLRYVILEKGALVNSLC